MTTLRAILLFASVGALAACQQVPVQAPSSVTPQRDGATEPPPSAAPVTLAPLVPPPSGPVGPAQQQQAQRIAMSAVGMLEAGHEEEGLAEVQRALATDPNNRLALSLSRQITSDPLGTLGRDSFAYTVRPNESLSMIAGRFLGDIYAFYILARYNGIAVPRQVAGGQVLRIPGKAPPATAVREAPAPVAAVREAPRAEPAPAPAAPAAPPEPTVAERGGNLELALVEYRKAAGFNEAGASARVDKVRHQLVQRYALNARTAFARQDLDGAIKAWDRVLNVDPANETAKLERQRALTLKDKAKKL